MILKLKNSVAFIVFIVCFMLVSLDLHANKKIPAELHMAFARPTGMPATQWLLQVYYEAFRRMGITLVPERLPNKRASFYANHGLIDGELGRVYSYNEKYPNLIRVEEHIEYVTFTAYSIHSDIKFDGWDSLQNGNYQIEQIEGSMLVSKKLKQLIPEQQYSESDTIEQAMGKLLSGRADVLICLQDIATNYLNSENYKAVARGKKIYNAGIMERVKLYPWLHHSHKNLQLNLSKILKKMKKEGIFSLYRNQYGLTDSDISW